MNDTGSGANFLHVRNGRRATDPTVGGGVKRVVAPNPPPPVRGRKGQRLGYLLANGQTNPVPCLVRDLDGGVATLVVGGWLGIPDRFSLYVEPDQLRLECVIAERRGNSVTVRY